MVVNVIRGVHKNVIEISDTGNDCFERAILFVRPENAEKDNDQIRRRATDYLSGLKLRPWFYLHNRMLWRAVGWFCAAAVGAAATALLFLL